MKKILLVIIPLFILMVLCACSGEKTEEPTTEETTTGLQTVKVTFPDGAYVNRLTGEKVQIKDGILHCDGNPVILVNDGI